MKVDEFAWREHKTPIKGFTFYWHTLCQHTKPVKDLKEKKIEIQD